MQRNLLAALLALLFPSLALAWAPRGQALHFTRAASANQYNVLEAVALNASSAATRTLTVNLVDAVKGTGDSFNKLVVVVDYTYSAATTVTATPTCSTDGGSTYASETSTAIAAGTGTVSAYSDTYTTGGASAVIRLVYDVSGCTHYKVLFGGASAGAGDLVDVQAVAVVGE